MARPRIVGIDANHDEATIPPFEYRKRNVYPAFQDTRFDLQTFSGPEATNATVDAKAVTPIAYLTGSGHGRRDLFYGFETRTLYGLNSDQMDEPKGKIVHFLACETAIKLGPDFVAHGCKAFFGYDDIFVYPSSNDPEFFACDSEIDLLFAQGFTAGKVEERVRELFDQTIDALRQQGKLQKAALLEQNRDSLRRFGNKTARLL